MSDKKVFELMKGAIEEVARKNRFVVKQVILFGSRAKEEHRLDSDWDILVVIDQSSDMNKEDLWFKIYKVLHSKFDFSFDVIVKFADEFEKEKDIVNTVSNEARREGVFL